MLKLDFHMHSNEDPLDWPIITHNSFQLVDEAARLGYEVISLTLHETLHYPKALQNYAQKKNILLIPGMEATIEGKHVLVINPPLGTKIPYTFDELEKIRHEGALTIAAHPFYPLETCLGPKLREHINVFDAIEHCHFYNRFINRNKKAIEIAEEYNKPLVANSDMHHFYQYNTNYTLVDAEKETDDILEAIRKNKLRLVTRPLNVYEFSMITTFIASGWLNPRNSMNRRAWRKTHPIHPIPSPH